MTQERFNETVREYIYRDEEYVNKRMDEDIEKYRKGNATIKFVDKDGNEVKGVKVEGGLKKHLFNFGANIFMLDEMETEEKNIKYKEYFKKLFNMATLPFYWRDMEPEEGKPRYEKDSVKVYRRPALDLCVEWCKENGVRPKAHCLNYDQWIPDWIDGENVPLIKEKLEKRFKELSERYAEEIYPWEVTNETLWNKHWTKFYLEDDYVEWSFEKAEKCFPNNELIINEAMPDAWEVFTGNRTRYYMQIQRLISTGHRVDAIGMQYHMFWHRDQCLDNLRNAYDLKRFYEILDKYAEFGKPMQITEITIPAYTLSEDDEALQAELITRLYKMWFSHPNMEAIIYWNLVDGYAAYAPQGSEEGENYYHGGLIRYDLTEKPAYTALYNLIHKEWNTEVSGMVDGELAFRGFYGEYEISAEVDEKRVTAKFDLSKNSDNEIVVEI